jgi:hypothetical protein
VCQRMTHASLRIRLARAWSLARSGPSKTGVVSQRRPPAGGHPSMTRLKHRVCVILVSAERACDFPQKPIDLLGTGESIETPTVSQKEDFTSSVPPARWPFPGQHHKDVITLSLRRFWLTRSE